jgi:pyrroloquinoline quinone (PQQ) biosynthesis protein C
VKDIPLGSKHLSDMLTADRLMEKIDALVSSYRKRDPWNTYSTTRLTRAGAALYCQQHGVFTRHSRRAWAYVVGQCPEVEVRRFIVRENLYEEEGSDESSHYLKLVRMANALGVSDEEMHGAKPLPGTRAALLMWETLTKDRPWLIGATAKGALEMRTPSGAEGERWMKQLGLSRADCDFWLLHQTADQIHGPGAVTLVLKYLPRYPEISEDDILAAAEDGMMASRTFRLGIVEAADALAGR